MSKSYPLCPKHNPTLQAQWSYCGCKAKDERLPKRARYWFTQKQRSSAEVWRHEAVNLRDLGPVAEPCSYLVFR
jgi:hypothetical protein